MKIHFPKLYRHERKEEPCQICIPYPGGIFTEGMHLRITDGEQELPVQTRILSRYRDGSVRFLSARFTANLPGMQGKTLEATMTDAKTIPCPGIRLTQTEMGLSVDAGEGGPVLCLRHDGTALIVE